MKKLISSFLVKYSKKTISLEQLEHFSHSHQLNDHDFAEILCVLEDEGVLEAVKSQGRTIRKPHLAYSYRIKKNKLKEGQFARLQRARASLDLRISLDKYFKLDIDQFEKDEPYLHKISAYLKKYGLPTSRVPAPERSFELVNNEKWITEEGGEECLKRIELWDDMNIFPVADPLMLAVNVKQASNNEHLHLIVENKTTYQGLLPVLQKSTFTTLIYGAGRKILKGLEQFHDQIPLEGEQRFYYFGDLDWEGLNIWYELTQSFNVVPALPFYKACLEQPSVSGKTNQRKVAESMKTFTKFFDGPEQKKMTEMLETGKYLPQEVLKTAQLQEIWRKWR